MKKFAFRLHRFLSIKIQQKRALAAVIARIQRQIIELDTEKMKVNEVWLSWRERQIQQHLAPAHERLELTAYMESLDQHLSNLQERMETLIIALDKSRRDFEMATRGVKTLENLRARKLEEYNREYERTAQREADEMAMQKQWHVPAAAALVTIQSTN